VRTVLAELSAQYKRRNVAVALRSTRKGLVNSLKLARASQPASILFFLQNSAYVTLAWAVKTCMHERAHLQSHLYRELVRNSVDHTRFSQHLHDEFRASDSVFAHVDADVRVVADSLENI
jgi:hypothetical protein